MQHTTWPKRIELTVFDAPEFLNFIKAVSETEALYRPALSYGAGVKVLVEQKEDGIYFKEAI